MRLAVAGQAGGLLLRRDRTKTIDANEVADASAGLPLLTGFARHARGIPERVEPIGIVAQHQAGERPALFEDCDLKAIVREDQAVMLLEDNALQFTRILSIHRIERKSQEGKERGTHGWPTILLPR